MRYRNTGSLRGATALIIIVAALSPVANAAPGEAVTLDTHVGFTYDDNVNRAERGNLREGDAIWSLAGTAGYRRQLGHNHGIIAKLGLATDVHTDFGDLNAVSASGSLTWLAQPVPGFSAPWIALTAGYALTEHAASDIRDGTEARLGIEAGQRFTDRLSARAGYTVRDRDASKARVFEQHSGQFHVIGDYAVTPRLGAYIKYDYRRGDVVTGAPRTAKLVRASRTVARDRVFGPANVAWRLGGEVHSLRLGSKFSLAKRTAVNLSAQHSLTEADGDNQWNVWNVAISINHRFD